jgi:uncharacterized protein
MKFKIFHEDQDILKQCKRFIAGWHGLGEIGYITVSHMIEDLKLKRIATIMSSGAPPFISVQNNQLRLPFEIYGKEEYDFAVFIPHLQPYRHVQIEFSEKMSEWILKQNTFSEAYFIGGVDARLKTSESNIQYIPTRAFLQSTFLNSNFLSEVKTNLLDPGLFVAGPLAIMLGYLDMSMFPAVGLLAYAQRERPDPLGAVSTIGKLNEVLDININTNELVQNAQTIEEEIKRQLAPIEENQADNLANKRIYT